jgi:hypothetical protein
MRQFGAFLPLSPCNSSRESLEQTRVDTLTYGRCLLPWRHLGAALVALAAILTRVPAHAQQAPLAFDPALEVEIWETQPPDKIGRRVQPPCIPEDGWIWDEELSYFSADTTCSPAAQWAQEEAEGRHDQLLFPAGVAIYEPTQRALANGFPAERRILVADRYNHRMLVFVPAGDSSTPLDVVRPGDVEAAHWNGFPTPTAPWPVEFPGLLYPEHLTVDRGGFVWIANLGQCRIEVFKPTGQFHAAIALSNPCEYWSSRGLFPYGVAVNDDAEFGVSGRVAVVAQDYATQGSEVIVFNAATGEEIGRHAPDPFGGPLDTPGALNLATAIDYHRANGVDRLVVADTENNRIQVFETDSETDANPGAPKPTPVLIFGGQALIDQTTGEPINESRLQWPYSVKVDARGRVLVSDSIGNREAFFTINFDGAPSASFLYELNARGGLNGTPRGVAEDSDHSLYIVDTGNHEVEVFEMPSLAIIDVDMMPLAPRQNGTVTIDFSVLVPETKSAVPNVTPSCGVASGGLSLVSGPTAIDGTPAGAVNIAPVPGGGVYRYRCEFEATATGSFELAVGANGGPSGTEVNAPLKLAGGTVADCGGPCEGDAPRVSATVSDPLAVNGFYPAHATITLNAFDPPGGAMAASGIKRVLWKWVSSSAMGQLPVNPAFACADQPAPTQCVEFGSAAPQQTVEVVASTDGLSTLEFWTEDAHGNASERERVAVAVDTVAPVVTIQRRTALSPVNWYNTDVWIDLTFSDPLGLTSPSQIVTTPPNLTSFHFSDEGRNQSQSVSVADLAGNTWLAPLVSTSIMLVNIDKGAPQTTASSALGLFTDNQVFLQSAPPVLTLTAIDPILSTGEDGSGVTHTYFALDGGAVQTATAGVTISATQLGPHTIEFWSRDLAGNKEARVPHPFYINALPIALPDAASTNEDTATTINVLVNDTDANDRGTDPLSVRVVTPSPNGTAVVQANQSITFMPQSDFAGVTTFAYEVSDAHGGTATATVTVSVIATNVPPVAVHDLIPPVMDGSAAVQFNVLTNDTDADGDALSILSFTPLTPPIGTLASVGNGVFSFTPPASVGGTAATTTFAYVVRDNAGATSTGRVTLTVLPSNRAPVCTSAYGGEIWPPNHKKFEIAGINGVTDPDGQSVTIQILSIMQDEPTDTTGDGKFSPDASGVGGSTAWLRAERMGDGNGRVYRISFKATDTLGGSCTGTVYYTVPHDRGKKPSAIAGSTWYDSTVHVPATHHRGKDKDDDRRGNSGRGSDHDDDRRGDSDHDRDDDKDRGRKDRKDK